MTPMYEFQGSTGKRITRFYHADKAPKIGEEIRHAGRWYRRIPSFVLGTGRIERSNLYPYVSSALPPTVKGCKFVTTKSGHRKPIIESAKHERNVMAQHGYTRDAACWDDVDDPK